MDNTVIENDSTLTLGEKLFSIPISIAAIVLGVFDYFNSGISILSVFPLFVGLENIIFLVYRRNSRYRRIALFAGILLFTCMVFFLIVD